MAVILLVLLLIFSVAHAREISIQPCEDPEGKSGKVLSVDVEPCPKEPCEIARGEAAIITARCLSNANADKLKLSIYAVIAGAEVPYPGMKRDACTGKNLTCPITENQEIRFVQQLAVKSFFPKIETTAKVTLVTNDDQDKTVCCFKTPVKVV